MDIVTLAARTILFFTNEAFIIFFISIGYWVHKKDIYARTLLVALFSIIINTYLKSFFKVPLPHWLGEGWAFPSGHTQFSVVFFGWLAWEIHKRWAFIMTAFLISGIGWALIYFGYHRFSEVLGGLGAGGGILVFYYYFLKIKFIKKYQELSGIFLGLLTLPLIILSTFSLIILWPSYLIYMWGILETLIAFSVGWFYSRKTPLYSLTMRQKILKIFLGVGGIGLIYLITKKSFGLIPEVLIALWVSYGCEKVYGHMKGLPTLRFLLKERKKI